MALSTGTFTTQYVTERTTTEVFVSPTFISTDVTITVTSHIPSTVTATFGQTVTIETPSILPPQATLTAPVSSTPPSLPTITSTLNPTAKYTPSLPTTTETATIVITELDVYIQNNAGNIYSTWFIPFTPAEPPTSTPNPGWVYVVDSTDDGWDNWSKGDKAGLIVGVVIGACMLFAMIWYCCRRPWKGNWWFASGWPTPQQQAMAFETPGPNFVQPTYVNGPVMPYAYPQGYGLRGGASEKETRRLFSGRNWFSVKQRGPGRQEHDTELSSGGPQETLRRTEESIGSARGQGRRKASGKNWFTAGAKRDLDSVDHEAQQADGQSPEGQRSVDRRAPFYLPPQPQH